jgi:regulator of protease activity HflC (stomatin/prohibitin superfamily)
MGNSSGIDIINEQLAIVHMDITQLIMIIVGAIFLALIAQYFKKMAKKRAIVNNSDIYEEEKENEVVENVERTTASTSDGNGGVWALFSIFGFNIVRPTRRGLIERLGKYSRYVDSGFCFVIPFIERVIQVNITEQMVSSGKREMITKDRLNALVDAQIYFKVKPDESSVKSSQYSVNNYAVQIVALAKTTLRNIIGTMELKEANSDRNKINQELLTTLIKETSNWGIEIVRTELKEIDPPKDVQESMNKVIKAENEKIAAINFANATETEADGKRRASIKQAEGVRQATILEAEGKAQAIQLVNESAEKYFKGNAQELKKLEVTQAALQSSSKIVIPEGKSLVNVIGDLAGSK